MSSDSHHQIPTIDLSIHSQVDRGTDQWYHLCKKVREACETYGCFGIVYDKIPQQSRAKTFSVSKQLFSLPLETKREHVNAKPGKGYKGTNPQNPLYESFGFEAASNYESLRSLMELNLPNGHNQFCTVVSMMKQLVELKDMIYLMILDSYGVGEKSNSFPASNTLLGFRYYMAPSTGEYSVGIRPHTDKALSTILCENLVSGLEFETKDGHWVKLPISPTSYVFLVGDLLMAWSNGRMHSVKHRVMICGNKDRHSLGLFSSPVEGAIVKAQKELIDEEHPRVLNDIDYIDFSKFIQSVFEERRAINSENIVFDFAGVRK